MKLKNKYHAQGVRDPEHGYFHSKAELARWYDLLNLQRAKKIDKLERQVKRPLSVNGHHIADIIVDFAYLELGDTGHAVDLIYEDKKGVITPDWALKAKLFAAIYGKEIRIT